MKRIAVVGAGVSGLTAAYYLNRIREEQSLELEIALLEACDRPGGVIRSVRKDGLLLEGGPEGWASYKPAAKVLVKDLGLQQDLIGSKDIHRRTFIVNQGQLTELPKGMAFFAPVDPISFWRSAPISIRGKFRASLEPFISRSKGDLSVQQFFERRLGSEFTEEVVEPLISAILGSDFRKVSARSALPEMYGIEQRTGSLWKGMRRFANIPATVSTLNSMRHGMGQVIEGLVNQLGQVQSHYSCGQLKLKKSNGSYSLVSDAFEGEFDSIIFCTPAHATASIVQDPFPETAGILNEIPYGSSNLVYLAYERSGFTHDLNGFGFIVPSREAGTVDACTWVSTKWDGRCSDDRVLIRCAIHSGRKHRADLSDEALVEAVHQELHRLLKINSNPCLSQVFRVKGSLPQLLVGHSRKLERISESLKDDPNLYMAGSYWGGVGVPDCIKTGKAAAERVAESLFTA